MHLFIIIYKKHLYVNNQLKKQRLVRKHSLIIKGIRSAVKKHKRHRNSKIKQGHRKHHRGDLLSYLLTE